MEIRPEEKADVVILHLKGDMIGGPDAAMLGEELHQLIESGKRRFLLDMAEVDWMNSSGLGILIGGLTTVRNSGGDLKLLGLSRKIRELLKITKLDCVFETFDQEGEALESFA